MRNELNGWKTACIAGGLLLPASLGALDFYFSGNPGPEEQLFVELINRARADAVAEGERINSSDDPDLQLLFIIFGTHPDQITADFAALPPSLPPLAIHPSLRVMAQKHTEDMLLEDFQESTGSDGLDPSDRALSIGYNFNFLAENNYTIGDSLMQIHWVFQLTPATRENIHAADAREIGIGLLEESRSDNTIATGPFLATQDFGARPNADPLLTGVVYWDEDADGFYDTGEGLPGVLVEVDGETHYTVTADGGGYALPLLSGNGDYTVRFVAPGLAPTQHTVTVIDGQNVKLDRVETTEPTAYFNATTDVDGDGYTVFLDGALDGKPITADRDGANLNLRYTLGKADLRYRVLRSSDLGGFGWTTDGVSQSPDPESAAEGTEVTATVALPAGGPVFLRLEVYPQSQ